MTLSELINYLEAKPKDQIIKIGFHNPHSYRGYYSELAFEPKVNAISGEMLECAKSSLGETYQGYKGGDYTMNEYTDVYIAEYGNTGEEISELLLKYMFNDI